MIWPLGSFIIRRPTDGRTWPPWAPRGAVWAWPITMALYMAAEATTAPPAWTRWNGTIPWRESGLHARPCRPGGATAGPLCWVKKGSWEIFANKFAPTLNSFLGSVNLGVIRVWSPLRQLHLCPGRLRFSQLPELGGTAGSPDGTVDVRPVHDQPEVVCRGGCCGQLPVLHRGQRWDHVLVLWRTLQHQAQHVGIGGSYALQEVGGISYKCIYVIGYQDILNLKPPWFKVNPRGHRGRRLHLRHGRQWWQRLLEHHGTLRHPPEQMADGHGHGLQALLTGRRCSGVLQPGKGYQQWQTYFVITDGHDLDEHMGRVEEVDLSDLKDMETFQKQIVTKS